jgi:hypothetical protein
MTAAQATDAVTEIHPVNALRTLHGAVVYGEHYCIALPQRNNLWSGLHARALLGEHELAATEVLAGFGKQNRRLQRENVLAVKVLVQAVVVVGPVLKQ